MIKQRLAAVEDRFSRPLRQNPEEDPSAPPFNGSMARLRRAATATTGILTVAAVLNPWSASAAIRSGINAGKPVTTIPPVPAKVVHNRERDRACGNPGLRVPVDRQLTTMQCLLNYVRYNGLTIEPLLSESGREKIMDEVGCNNFSHTPCAGEEYPVGDPNPAEQAAENPFLHFPALLGSKAEILAFGCGPGGTAESIMSGWMHSDDHRPIIEDENLTIDGISRIWITDPSLGLTALAPLCDDRPIVEWAVDFEGP